MPELSDLLASLGDPEPVDGLRTLDLGSESLWLVTSGEVEMFVQNLRSDGSRSARKRVLSVPAGEVLPGVTPVPEGAEVTGVGLPGSEVVEVPRDRASVVFGDAQLMAALTQRLGGGVDERLGQLVADASTSLAGDSGDVAHRAELEDHHRREAVAALASVLGAEAEPALGDRDRLEFLQVALERLGEEMGVSFGTIRDLPRDSTRDPLLLACDAAGVRGRWVHLGESWWRQTSGPLLALRSEDHRPVALIPASARRYRAYDAEQGRWVRVDAEMADGLMPMALAFTEPLPKGEVTPRALLRVAFHGTRRSLTTIAAAGLFAAVLSLIVPLATSVVFNTVIPDGRLSLLASVGSLFAGAALAVAALAITQALATLRAAGQVQGALQPALWDRLLRLPASFFRRYTVGDLANRVDGVDTIRQVLTNQALGAGLALLFSTVSLGLLFVLDWVLALVALAAVGVLFAVLIGLNLWRVRFIQEVVETRGTVSGLVFQLLESVPKLRVAGAEARALRAWSDQFRRQVRAGYTAGVIEAWLTGAAATATSAIAFVLYWVVASDTATLAPGTFLAFTAALGQFVGALTAFNTQLSAMVESIPLYRRFLPLIEADLEQAPDAAQPGNLSGDLRLEGVTFRYDPDGPPILDNVDLAARPGEFVAVTGPSGAGKSTLLRLLLAFELAESGHVLYDGKELTGLDLAAVRRQIGTVLQGDVPATGSVQSVILGDTGGSEQDAWDAAAAAGLADDIRAMPMGMRTVVSEAGSTFSGGQVQRLTIARAIAAKPRIVLMDEATSALDNRTQAAVAQALDELDATRVVIAHRLSTIRDADRIVVLDRGRVVQTGTYDELAGVEGLFRELVHRQLVDDHETTVAMA